MAGIPDVDPNAEVSEEEAKRKLAEAQAYLLKEADRGRKQFAFNVKSAQDRLAFARKELAELDDRRTKLLAHQQKAGADYLLANVDVLRLVFSSVAMMMDETIACNRHNLELVSSEQLPEQAVFRVPQHEGAFLYARSRLDLALALLGWYQYAEGIDVVLRAAVGAQAIQPRNAAEEAERAARAQALKQAVQSDRDMAILLGRLGTELQEAEALIEWAKSALARLRDQPPALKRPAFADTDWAKLNGKAVFMATLGDTVAAFPALARYFPRQNAAPLPYDELAWSGNAGSGRLLPGSGRLSTSTGGLPRG